MKKAILLLVVWFSVIEIKAQNLLYDSVRIEAILRAEKDSIAKILDLVSCKDFEQIGFINKYSSNFDFSGSFGYCGMNYIYLFHLILSLPKFNQINRTDSLFVNTSRRQKYQFYQKCILVKKHKAKVLKPTYKDISYLKRYLKLWWSQNRNLDFGEIQLKWINEVPLRKIGYEWQ